MGVSMNLMFKNWQNKGNISYVYNLLLLAIVMESAIQLAAGRECYKCSSTSDSDCNSIQNKTVCKEHQHACLTIQYQSILPLNGTYYVENKFKKECASGNIDCNINCLPYEILGMKKCKVHCCEYNLCNGRVKINKRTRKIISGKKHLVEHEKSSAISLRRQYHFYLICMILVISAT